MTTPALAPYSEETAELLERWPMGHELALPPASVSVVAGAYTGRVMKLLSERYSDYQSIDGYDMQTWAIEQARERLKGLHGCTVHPYGLGTETREAKLVEWGTDAASIVGLDRENPRETGIGVLIEYWEAMGWRGPRTPDLFVMNMEGYEFELLPHILAGVRKRIPARFCIQWHHGFGNDANYAEIQHLLSLTHELVIDDAPRWQFWRDTTRE